MRTKYINFNLIDGKSKKIQKNMQLVVENGRIIDINKNKEFDINAIDLKNKFVMPGLIDCHTHMFMDSSPDPVEKFDKLGDADLIVGAVNNLKRTLESGVTFIRDVGGYKHYDIQLRNQVKNNSIIGPDMFCAGKIVTMTGGHGHFIGREADGVVEVRKAVREQLKAGADVIKVISSGGVMTPGVDVNAYQFNIDELRAAVEEAHKAGRKVCTHCHGTKGIKNSIIAGVDSIEHATLLDDEAIQMLVEKGTYIVPTLAAVHYIVENGEEAGIPKSVVDKAREISIKHFEGFKKAYDAGVNIAMGTDAGTPFNIHGNNFMELILMVRAGMTPMDAITTATKNSSELIGIDEEYGTLESGKYADFIVLNDNPIDDIETFKNIDSVFKKGKKIR
jgi:imidazolonepropionase-like amidohydrolase